MRDVMAELKSLRLYGMVAACVKCSNTATNK